MIEQQQLFPHLPNPSLGIQTTSAFYDPVYTLGD